LFKTTAGIGCITCTFLAAIAILYALLPF